MDAVISRSRYLKIGGAFKATGLATTFGTQHHSRDFSHQQCQVMGRHALLINECAPHYMFAEFYFIFAADAAVAPAFADGRRSMPIVDYAARAFSFRWPGRHSNAEYLRALNSFHFIAEGW